jgi:hypothetical protein
MRHAASLTMPYILSSFRVFRTLFDACTDGFQSGFQNTKVDQCPESFGVEVNSQVMFNHQQGIVSGTAIKIGKGYEHRHRKIQRVQQTVFQMDQTESQNQKLLRYIRKRSENPNLVNYLGVCSRSHHENRTSPQRKPLHNFTGVERFGFRKSSNLSVNYRELLQKRTDCCF